MKKHTFMLGLTSLLMATSVQANLANTDIVLTATKTGTLTDAQSTHAPQGKIGFVQDDGRGTSMLNVMDLASGQISTLWQMQGSIFSPAVHQDTIAYATQGRNALPVIYLHHMPTGQRHLVTPFYGNNIAPSFSQDGSSLLFSGSHEHNNPNIYRLDLRTKRLTAMTTHAGAENSPAYLPAGLGFVYTADDGTRTPSLYLHQYGQSPKRLAQGTYAPKISADGGKIGYVQAGKVVVSSLNGLQTMVVGDAIGETALSFSPDGKYIVYTNNTQNQSKIIIRSLTDSWSYAIPMPNTVKDPVWF